MVQFNITIMKKIIIGWLSAEVLAFSAWHIIVENTAIWIYLLIVSILFMIFAVKQLNNL